MAVPGPPSGVSFSSIADTSVVGSFTDGSNGGKAITHREIWWDLGYNFSGYPGMEASLAPYFGPTTATGLARGTTYYFWARTGNADGWGEFGPRTSVKTYSNWTLPYAPGAPILTVRSGTSIELDWGGDGNGHGHPIEAREYWQSYDGTARVVRPYAGNYIWTGLSPGTTYYFWAKNRTRVGWSPLSARAAIRTWAVPPAPNVPGISSITQRSFYSAFTSNGDGGESVDEWQLGYGLSSTSPTNYITAPGGKVTVSGLEPGRRYYAWARGRNAVGWGSWSARAQVDLVAGAWVNVNGIWRKAVPYVNVAGVWKLAQPWTKIAGVWKENRS